MLDGRAPGFARELGETRLMDQVAATWFDPNPPDMFQTFDQTEHGGWCGGFRHLPQPCEPAQAGLFPTLRERIEPARGFMRPAGHEQLRVLEEAARLLPASVRKLYLRSDTVTTP